MATPYAFVTLVTSDFYLPGALALAAALKDLHPSPPTPPEVEFQTVCLVTPETVDVTTVKLLRRAFNLVIGVEIIEQEDDRKLRLLGRPDLTTVLTKLHIFRLTQYSKIIFLDADVLPISPISHLFNEPHEFSAVPDVGWPDIFNSGVLVASPGEDKFNELMELQKTKGSWDGGDQGLLNEWRGSNWHRLSFVYNTTPTAAYTYAPAYERFGSAIRAVHFIGPDKPWKGLTYRSPGIKSSEATLGDGTKRAYNYEALVDRWYQVYDTHYRMEPEPSPYEFQFQAYSSAWDDNSSLGAEVPVPTSGPYSAPGATLGLDELRRIAVEGLSSFQSGGGASSGPATRPLDGEYRSMPLEGRVDLMRPRKENEPESKDQAEQEGAPDQAGNDDEAPGTPRPSHVRIPSDDGGYFRGQPLPTPAPYELPPAPYHHGGSLPPTQTPTPYYGPPSQYNDPQAHQNSLQVFYQPQAQREHGSEYMTGSHQHGGSQQFRQIPPTNPYIHPSQPSHISHHHRRHVPSPVQQRSPWDKHDSSDSDRTPPTGRPYSQPSRHHHHHHHHAQHPQGSVVSPQPQHYNRPLADQRAVDGGQQQRYESPARGEQRRGGYETPPRQQQQGGQQRRTHRGSDAAQFGRQRAPGDHTPTQEQTRRGRDHQEAQRVTQNPQGQVHFPQAHNHVHFQEQPNQTEYRQQPAQIHLQQPRPHHGSHSHSHPHVHVHHPAPPAPEQREQPRRPVSPPKVSWNPAVEPPPNDPPPASAFPQDTYFPNIWDQTSDDQPDSFHHSYPSPQGERAGIFFSPPPPPAIPDQLVREGQYSNVLGPAPPHDSPESVSTPPAPDKAKVHAVFPWEEKPRHVPRRVFPRTDTPPPAANYIESERTSSPVSTPPPPPPERVTPQVQTPSPLASPWTNIGFSNAWDTVPSIQRYASKLVGSPKIFPYQFMAPPPMPRDDDWKLQWEKQREKDWQDRHDASSMDGDDEDEGDEDESGEDREHSDGSARGKRSQSSRHKSRASSRSRKKYRSRGIQAMPETNEKEIQCTIISAEDIPSPRTSREVGVEATPTVPLAAPTGVGLGIRRQWPAEIPQTLLPSAVPRDFRPEPEQGAGTPRIPTAGRSGEPFSSLASPSGLRSPATLGSPRTYSPPRSATPLKIPTPPKITSPPAVSSPLRGPPSPVVAPARPSLKTPRPTGSPRKLSSSSAQGSSSSRASSPVISTTGKMVQSTPPPKHTRLSSLSTAHSPQLARSISAETAMTASPTTTHDSPVTPDNANRRGGRVWDPARGVDVFKRGSEEVLARFLRMGSFDEGEGKRQAA